MEYSFEVKGLRKGTNILAREWPEVPIAKRMCQRGTSGLWTFGRSYKIPGLVPDAYMNSYSSWIQVHEYEVYEYVILNSDYKLLCKYKYFDQIFEMFAKEVEDKYNNSYMYFKF